MSRPVVILSIYILITSCASIETQESVLNQEISHKITSSNDLDYLIGPEDLLGIEVFQVKDFSLTVRVNPRGLISLPLIGEIKASGMTSDELQELIEVKLNESYLQNPHVSVFIKEYTSQRVTVEGSVKKPGIYPLKGKTTLLQAIASAQGLTDLADKNEIQLYRTEKNGSRVNFRFNVSDIRNGESIDPVLKGDDIIIVQKSETRSVLKSIADTLRGFISFGNPLD